MHAFLCLVNASFFISANRQDGGAADGGTGADAQRLLAVLGPLAGASGLGFDVGAMRDRQQMALCQQELLRSLRQSIRMGFCIETIRV